MLWIIPKGFGGLPGTKTQTLSSLIAVWWGSKVCKLLSSGVCQDQLRHIPFHAHESWQGYSALVELQQSIVWNGKTITDTVPGAPQLTARILHPLLQVGCARSLVYAAEESSRHWAIAGKARRQALHRQNLGGHGLDWESAEAPTVLV